MDRIKERFKVLRKKGQKALVTYICGGYPDMDSTMDIISTLKLSGVDFIEIGIPCRNPRLDGKLIKTANLRAINSGADTDKVLGLINRIKKTIDVPVIILAYRETVVKYGVDNIISKARDSGVCGIIVPDIHIKEDLKFIKTLDGSNIDIIFTLSPRTTQEEIRRLSYLSKGFIYCRLTDGMTGIRKRFSVGGIDLIERVRKFTKKPIVAGFGIGAKAQAYEVSRYADGIAIGSVLSKIIEESGIGKSGLNKLNEFIKEIKDAINST